MTAEVDLESRLYVEIAAESLLWRRALEVTKNTSGFSITPIVSFSRTELAQATHYQLRPLTILKETEADYWANRRRLEELRPLRSAAGELRLLDELFLSEGRLKDTSVGAVGDWTEEYVGTPSAVHQLRSSGLRGFVEKEVHKVSDGKVRPGLLQIYSDSILPTVVWDESTAMVENPPPAPSSFRQLGSLTYERAALKEAADFNRTAEPWAGNGMPTWVVSAAARTVVMKCGIRGWRFFPVLVADTPLYDDYRRQWVSLWKGMTEANPRNSFR